MYAEKHFFYLLRLIILVALCWILLVDTTEAVGAAAVTEVAPNDYEPLVDDPYSAYAMKLDLT